MITLIRLVNALFTAFNWILLARIILSWVPGVNYYHPVVRWIYRVTEPVMAPFRRLVPPLGGLDLSPILVFFALNVVRSLIINALWTVGRW